MTYHFLNLDLQPIGDEGTWDGSLDNEYNNMSPTAPSNGGSGGSLGTGSGYLYLGLNGQWGTYGSGGSGGSGWSPVPMNGSDPATGYSLPPNLPETLPYLQALEVILKVATALISPQPETVAKKAMLHQVRDLLVHEVGLYARDYGVYSGDNYTRVGLTQAMGGVFNNIFVTAYGSNGAISKTEAVNQGIALAKALLADTRSVRLQTFQAQVLATTLGSVDAAQHTPELRQTALALADSYSRFRPGTDSYQGMATNLNSSYLDALWQLQQPFVLGQRPAYWNINQTWGATTVSSAASGLRSELNWKQTANHAGLTEVNALKALRAVNTMLGALSQVSPLWQGQGSGVQDGIFLRQALGLAMALAKLPTSPSSTAGDSGNWVNAILQGDAQTAATGLAQLFAGMETADPLRLRQQLNFVETLLNVAAAVDDPTLDQVVLQSAFLSQYLNLGGAYAALNPNVDGTLGFFLDTAWQERSQDFNFGSGYVGTGSWSPISVKASNELEGFLKKVSPELTDRVFALSAKLLVALQDVSAAKPFLNDPKFLQTHIKIARDFIRLNSEPSNNSSTTHLKLLDQAKTSQEVLIVAQTLQNDVMNWLSTTSIGGDNASSIYEPSPFIVDDDDARQIRNIIIGIDPVGLQDYLVYDVLPISSFRQFTILLMKWPASITNVERVYSINDGEAFIHQAEYLYVLRNGEVYYYGKGVPYYPKEGDRVAYAVPGSLQPNSNLGLNSEDQNKIKSGLEQISQFYEPLGRFTAGAVYQWAYDLGTPAREILTNLLPDWRKLDQSVEEDLPKDPAFVAGRLLGNGAGVITGLLEITAAG